MKWIFILAIFAAVSLFVAWILYNRGQETLPAGLFTVGAGAIFFALLFLLCMHIEDKKSEIEYAQLTETRAQIEQAFKSDNALAQAEALKLVVDYNAAVTKVRINLERPIVGEFYSKKVDWGTLEIIDWSAKMKGE